MRNLLKLLLRKKQKLPRNARYAEDIRVWKSAVPGGMTMEEWQNGGYSQFNHKTDEDNGKNHNSGGLPRKEQLGEGSGG